MRACRSAARWSLPGALFGLGLALAGCTAAGGPNALSPALPHQALFDGSKAEIELRLARAARVSGDLAGAVQLYRGVTQSPSTRPELLVEFGDTLIEAGMLDDAVQVYGRVDTTSAAGLGAMLGQARAHFELGDFAAALKAADQARALAPRDARVLVDRGAALDALHRQAEAQDAYRAALLIMPGDIAARNDLALSLTLSGKYAEAITLLSPLVQSPAATPRLRENLALIFGLSGDTERAEALSRTDLDAASTAANLAFFARLRD